MNPFLNKPKRGEIKSFYFDQFESVGIGPEAASQVVIHKDGNRKQVARYLDWYIESTFLEPGKYRSSTTVSNGDLWCAILEAE